MVNYIFSRFPEQQEFLGYVHLVSQPTPVERLTGLGPHFRHDDFYIKREDRTADDYGGNKVRNLEFVLGDVLRRGRKKVITLVPYGSNFTGALSAQGKKLGIDVYLSQFLVFRNGQIDAHAEFSARHGARLTTFDGRLGPVVAGLHLTGRVVSAHLENENFYVIAPGASSLLGALGHTNALLELNEQIQQGLVPEPDFLVVGAGTCGTIAGLMAGVKIAGLRTRVIGVRCAEKIVCNPTRISALSNRVLRHLGSPIRVSPREVDLRESPENVGYAIPTDQAKNVMNKFYELEGVRLDTTYTSKVALFLQRSFQLGEFRRGKVLYWHTFSASAL